ncbi:glycosyltransferase family 2 protein [Roseomonas sp. CECT 9278]|uniref:glycosyltransferase family 2 protein n=1 Tax=Roseomonas sp. CECT 9278 TaxID=2845823 RepID=UPI001E5D536D|nr:glycosyltransferase family 2 protein [Roseomonas sp. CECT 9278]CAH0221589.1 putative glycosyltransferase [Roseomonas sp. CECT 9278]
MEPLTSAIAAIIPCLDEEASIGQVVAAVRAQGIATVIVVDGGSRDATAQRARDAGATVVEETRRGYGRAVQSGIAALPAETDVVLFLDGDGSDPPERIPDVLAPILAGRADFVHGTRVKGEREPGALSPQQVAAGRIAQGLLRLFYGARFSDMSPFRAIRREALDRLGMREETYGWNLEMLMRVAAAGIPATEVAVGQRRRIGGVSKVSGNPRAVAAASWSIATTFLRLAAALRRG